MEKAIESDIAISNVVNDEIEVIAIHDINAVPVADVPVPVSQAVVVDGNVVPNVVVEVEQVQGEIR